MGAATVNPFNLLLPAGGTQPQQSLTPPGPQQADQTLPASDSTQEIPQQFKPDSTQEIPQQIDPNAARPELIDSIIAHESSGKPDATGQKGEKGLMQIMPATGRMYGVSPEQLLDPEINRQVGTRYFSDLLKQYKGNEWLALVAYNEGPGNLAKGQFFPQSVKYATSVLDRAGSRLQGLIGGQGGQVQLPQGMGQQPPQQQGANTLEIPQQLQPQQMAGGQPQIMIPPGFGRQQQDQDQQQPQSIQQMLAGQGPEDKYGLMGAQPFEALQAGQMFRPQETQQMAALVTGAGGPEEEIPQISASARGMMRRARAVGIDPADIAPLAQKVREGSLTERGLSQALKNLRTQLPDAAKVAAAVRGVGEDLPVNLRAAISQGVRAGDITVQQAKRMLKAGVGGLGAGMVGQQMMGEQQPQGAPTPQQPDMSQPGWLSRSGAKFHDLFEGTAYADEPPSPTPTPIPTPAGGLPPMLAPPTAGPPAAAAPPAGAPAPDRFGGMKPYEAHIGTSGSNVILKQPTLPPAAQTAELSTMTAMNQTKDALQAMQPLMARMKKGEFQGSLLTPEGRRAYFQPQAATQGRMWQALGMDQRIKLDPQVANLYDKLGPLTASQLHAMIGGRIGAWAVSQQGPLAPHLPNFQVDPLPRIYDKLLHLQSNLQIIQKSMAEYKAKGLTGAEYENAVISANGGDPNFDAGDTPAPPEGFE